MTRPGTEPGSPVQRVEFWVLGLILAVLWAASSPLACHNDLYVIAWAAHFVPDQWNVYEAAVRVNEKITTRLPYPPLLYWLVGGWMAAGRAVFGLFSHPGWDSYMATHDFENAMALTSAEVGYLKLLYLPFFLGTAILAARLVPSGRSRTGMTWLLLFQPIALFITLFMGQFDILPVFFCVAAVVLFSRGPAVRPCVLGFISLAAGTLFKNFPLVLAAGYLGLFLMRKEWRRGALYGFLAYAAVMLLTLNMVWGPVVVQNYLQFSGRDYVFLVGRTSTAGKLMEYFLLWAGLGILLTGGYSGVRSFPFVMRRAVEKLADPSRFRLAVRLLPLPFLSLILFERLWNPQYILWILPWVVLFGVSGPALYPEGHPAGTMARRLPAFLTLAFFPVVFARFPKSVDSDLLLDKAGGATLGTFLRPYEVLFTFIASCVLLWILIASFLALRRVLSEDNLPATASDPAPPPASEAWVYLAGFLLLIVLAMVVRMIPPP